jgi:hypothetical protein
MAFKDEHFTGGWRVTTSTTISTTLSATHTNEFVLLTINSEPNTSTPLTVVSVTDSAGLTWTKYAENHIAATAAAAGCAANVYCGIEVWWAYGTIPSTAYSVTPTMSGSPDNAVIDVTMYSGVNGSNPFNSDPSLPAKGTITTPSATPSLTVSTTAPSTIITVCGTPGTGLEGQPSFGGLAADFSYIETFLAGVNYAQMYTTGKYYSTAQSGVAVTGAQPNPNQVFMVFALNNTPAPPTTTTTTWSATDQLAAGTFALTNGGLTATITAGAGFGGVRSASPKTAGKLYAELKLDSSIGGSWALGVANSARALQQGEHSSGANMAVVTDLGGIDINDAGKGAPFTVGVGSVIGVAVDFPAKLIWFRNGASAWNAGGTADPATGVGGYDITAIISTGLMLLFQHGGGAATLNAGASAFVNAAPSGFTAWDVPPPSPSAVVLLMGFEGANGSIGAPGMNDESPANHGTAVSDNINAKIDTTQFKFGASSLTLPGSFSGIHFADHADWHLGAGQFTIECFIRPATATGIQMIVGQFGHGASNFGWAFYLNGAVLNWAVSTTGSDNLNDMSGGTIAVNTWTPVCIDFDGVSYRLYVNGAMVALAPGPRTIFNPGLILGIGENEIGELAFAGNIDELRITKGYARYASNGGYTPSASAFTRTSTPPPTPTTWNPADKDADIVLSSGNHIATVSVTGNHCVRGTTSHASGKWYLEYSGITITNGYGLGIATAAQSLSNIAVDSTFAQGIDATGNVKGTGGGGTLGAPSGHTIGMAIDITAGKYWFTYDGSNWAGHTLGADPGTGSLGCDYTDTIPAAVAVFPWVGLQSISAATETTTLNAGDSAFAFFVPTGFTAWDGSSHPTGSPPPTVDLVAHFIDETVFSAAITVTLSPVHPIAHFIDETIFAAAITTPIVPVNIIAHFIDETVFFARRLLPLVTISASFVDNTVFDVHIGTGLRASFVDDTVFIVDHFDPILMQSFVITTGRG